MNARSTPRRAILPKTLETEALGTSKNLHACEFVAVVPKPRDSSVMARPLRLEFPGAIYHVTSRGNEQRKIFRSDDDRSMFLQFLGIAAVRFRWSITAWVLMSNHFHLVVRTRDANLSRGMQWLNGRYAGWFNKKHNRCGHLFQGRFKSFVIDEHSYFTEVLRYVVLNPVRARLVPEPAIYKWSSFRATAGIDAPPAWLDVPSVHSLFADDSVSATKLYQEFVLTRVTSQERLWTSLINGMYLGSDAWAKEMRKIVESRIRSTDHPLEQRSVGRPTAQDVIAAVARTAGASVDDIRTRRSSVLRSLVAWIAWHEGLVTLRTIAASLRLRSEGYVAELIKRCEGALATDALLRKRLDLAVALLRN